MIDYGLRTSTPRCKETKDIMRVVTETSAYLNRDAK